MVTPGARSRVRLGRCGVFSCTDSRSVSDDILSSIPHIRRCRRCRRSGSGPRHTGWDRLRYQRGFIGCERECGKVSSAHDRDPCRGQERGTGDAGQLDRGPRGFRVVGDSRGVSGKHAPSVSRWMRMWINLGEDYRVRRTSDLSWLVHCRFSDLRSQNERQILLVQVF
jgi:hypothetical protein